MLSFQNDVARKTATLVEANPQKYSRVPIKFHDSRPQQALPQQPQHPLRWLPHPPREAQKVIHDLGRPLLQAGLFETWPFFWSRKNNL